MTAFDHWRTQKYKKEFSQSGINNHNAELNRVLDEAELNGWIVKSMRPNLLNKGTKSESRGNVTDAEYKQIYTALSSWHKDTQNEKAAATRVATFEIITLARQRRFYPANPLYRVW